jgi:hypothetical protein
MYVRSLRIENLRCFVDAKLDFQFPGREQEDAPDLPNVNLLLGINGAGKTTVLKAVALGLIGDVLPFSGFVPYELVRRSPRHVEAEARIYSDFIIHSHPKPGHNLELKNQVIVQRHENEERLRGKDIEVAILMNQIELSGDVPLFVVGYGSSRYVLGASQFEPLSSQLKRRSLRYQRIAGLFEDHLGLTPLGAWLPRASKSHVRDVETLLNDLLPEEAHFSGEMENDDYLFQHCGVSVPLGALSDGYRAYIGWISDLLYNLSSSAPKGVSLREIRGVVLVDEIDLHLHPEWQRDVIPKVARTLPNLQFIFTTHSPIVAGTLSSQNIFVLDMDGQGTSTVRQLEEPIHGRNADQILLSPYFKLKTTRAPDAVTDYRDLSRKAMSGDPKAALTFLEKITEGTEPAPSPANGSERKAVRRKPASRPGRAKTR